MNGSTPPGCGGVPVVSLKASCTVDPLNAGTYTFTATYNGDSDYTATETQITGYTVGQGTPTVTLSADPASGATVGTPVSLSATVAGPQGAPAVTGTISFTADGATVPGCGSVTVTAGTATCAAGTLPAGSHSFEADYSGDTNYLAASGTLSGYDVAKATPGVSLSATPSANANVDSQISLSATVQAVNGGPAPTGTVTFLANGAAVAGCSNVSLTGGAASCPVGQLPAGTYIFEADYSGDASYLTASGTVTDYTVTKVPADVAVTSDVAAPVWGQPVTFTATVTAEGKPVSSGTVQWSVNGSPVPVGADGKASLGPLTTLAVGTDKITAGYSGTDRIAAASGTDSIVVAKADTTTKLTIIGRTLLIATVKPVAPGAGRPAGTVTFTLGGRTLGTTTLSASGTAIININPTERGVISANYGGDAHFKGSSGSATLSG